MWINSIRPPFGISDTINWHLLMLKLKVQLTLKPMVFLREGLELHEISHAWRLTGALVYIYTFLPTFSMILFISLSLFLSLTLSFIVRSFVCVCVRLCVPSLTVELVLLVIATTALILQLVLAPIVLVVVYR